MDTRKPLDAAAVGIMILLALTWSLQQIVLKAVADGISPLMQLALRSGVAALLVGLLMAWRGERPALRHGGWKPGLAVAGLFAFEFLLIAEALRHTSAGHVVVFLYTAPIFAALGLHRKVAEERLSRRQWAGIGCAFAGIALAFLGRGTAAAADAAGMLWGDLLALAGGAMWGATTVVVRSTRLSRAPATETLLYQLAGAFVFLLAAALLMGQTAIRPTPAVLASLAFQSLVVAFASFLVWFALLRRYLASQLGIFSFMTPLFGVVLGALLLHEPVEGRFLAGAALVVAGIVLVSARRRAVPDAA